MHVPGRWPGKRSWIPAIVVARIGLFWGLDARSRSEWDLSIYADLFIFLVTVGGGDDQSTRHNCRGRNLCSDHRELPICETATKGAKDLDMFGTQEFKTSLFSLEHKKNQCSWYETRLRIHMNQQQKCPIFK